MYFKDFLDSLLSCCFLSWDNALYEFTVIFFWLYDIIDVANSTVFIWSRWCKSDWISLDSLHLLPVKSSGSRWMWMMFIWLDNSMSFSTSYSFKNSEAVCSVKKAVLKFFFNIQRKTSVFGSIFNNFVKKDSNTGFFLWILRNFQEHLF